MMLTIEITDEMVEPIADYLYGNNDRWTLIACRNALTAALPIIEQQVRDEAYQQAADFRKAQAAAWDDGYLAGEIDGLAIDGKTERNPYE